MSGRANTGGFELGPVWIDGSWWTASIVPVTIAVKPGDDEGPRPIRVNRGKIPVAILSTPSFNAAEQVNWPSLTFGRTGDEESLRFKRDGRPQCGDRDVNDDGLADLVCKFVTRRTGLEVGDSEAILKGLTVDGVPIIGSDEIVVKPRRRRGHGRKDH